MNPEKKLDIKQEQNSESEESSIQKPASSFNLDVETFSIKREREEDDFIEDELRVTVQRGIVDLPQAVLPIHQIIMTDQGHHELNEVKPAAPRGKKNILHAATSLVLCPSIDSDYELEKDLDSEDELHNARSYCTSQLGNEEEDQQYSSSLNKGYMEIENHNDSEDEGVPVSHFYEPPICYSANPSQAFETPRWRRQDFPAPIDLQWRDTFHVEPNWAQKPPIFFFHLLFDNDLVQHICNQTNQYALHKEGKKIGVNIDEIRAFLGILLYRGAFQFPEYRLFWKRESRYSTVADVMTRNRFDEIKRFLHFNDNNQIKSKDDPTFDKCFKIRPVLESVRRNCRKIPQEEHQVINEQIIPTKAKISFKQCNPQKPHQWGYKVISRAGESGFVYDFHLYTGKDSYPDMNGEFGISSGLVLKLAEGVPRNKNYKLFYGNWFSSLHLSRKLQETGIWSLATISPNRLKGCKLEEEARLKESGRAIFDFRIDEASNNVVVKWCDSKTLHILSSYAGVEPMDTCRRWDEKRKSQTAVQRPFAVKEYNRYQEGIDLCNRLSELYRVNCKSKKWYMRIFFYLIDLSVVNAWLLYRRACTVAPNMKTMPLLDFKLHIAHGLTAYLNHGNMRPCTVASPSPAMPKKRRRTGCQASAAPRIHNVGHYPEYVTSSDRCRKCVNARTKVKCTICKVSLCFTTSRNCFLAFHSRM